MSDIEIELLEKVEKIERGVRVLKEAVLKVINKEIPEGTQLEQIMDDILFDESYSERKDDCITEMSIIIEHLLKLKYCTNNRNHKVWKNSVKTHRGILYGYLQWLSKNPTRRLIEHLENNIENAYIIGVRLYNKDAEEYPDLRDGLKLIPEDCPWALEELMENDIEDLLESLNDDEE